MAEKLASLKPSDHTEGGGLLEDVNGVIKEAMFAMNTYNGKVSPGAPSILLEIDVEGDVFSQYWSVGSHEAWMPTDDGTGLKAIGKETALRTNSNAGILLKSLVDSGFPEDDLGDGIAALVGLQAHFIRVPAPKRPGLKQSDKNKDREPTLLVVSEVLSLPGEKKKPKGAPKTKTVAKPKAKPKEKEKVEDTGDVNEKATEIIMGILAEDGPLKVGQVPAKILAAVKGTDVKGNDIIKAAFAKGFFDAGPWEYEGDTLSIG